MSHDPDLRHDSTEMAHLVGEFIFWFATILVTVRCGRRWWLLYQGILTIVIALTGFISPHFAYSTVMKSLVGDFDDCHNFTIRVFSLLYLMYGLTLLYCLSSTDNRAVSALMECLFVTYALESVCHFIFWVRKPTGKPVHYPEKGLPFILAMMVGNFLHFIVGQTVNNGTKKQSGNLNSRFDALTLFIIGGSVYAFSKDILNLMTNKTDFDSAHVEVLSVASCYILCSASISLQADVFTQETRRKMYLCRIFVYSWINRGGLEGNQCAA
ncbi:hypothetical protein HOLleu_16831 [Holothuria leucospilota]|uniref:Uncharacterized protein n=1 Tax=Holothuria leucospilota TaxID=206669 RepID=A0A9Q1C5R9_HOLLE|nr:hypothetical protein HOLleu_16831 [Holothuria leucospilota]